MNVVEYMRKGRVKAMIYVRGQNEGIQEIMCKLYAEDKKYDVVKVVKNIDDVYDCDVLLVSHVSKINRNYIKYLQVVNAYPTSAVRKLWSDSLKNPKDACAKEKCSAFSRKVPSPATEV